MKQTLICIAIFSGNVFALSLGDNINANVIKAETTPQSVMTLSKQTATHNEYTISKASGVTTVLVNKQNVAYGFKWVDNHQI